MSLLGFEPQEDFEYLLREARGRRLFPAAPERSLLLLKASGQLPHGGGSRIDSNSFDYKKIVNSSAFCSTDDKIVSDNYKITSNEKIAIIPPIGGG